MSNHFTYEIDERNLRIQLKEFTVPLSDEAWQKFETFSDSMVSDMRENRLNSFNFTLNRNIVLPSVFGIIIILFSFLLVNFVSIKNPVKENPKREEAVTVKTITNQPAQPEKKVVPVVVNKVKPEITSTGIPATEAEKTKDETAVASAEVKKETPGQEAKVMPTQSPTANVGSSSNTNSGTPAGSSETSTPDSVANTAADEEAKAKRKAKRRAEAIESQKLLEIRPTPVMEERDAEIRPN